MAVNAKVPTHNVPIIPPVFHGRIKSDVLEWPFYYTMYNFITLLRHEQNTLNRTGVLVY